MLSFTTLVTVPSGFRTLAVAFSVTLLESLLTDITSNKMLALFLSWASLTLAPSSAARSVPSANPYLPVSRASDPGVIFVDIVGAPAPMMVLMSAPPNLNSLLSL